MRIKHTVLLQISLDPAGYRKLFWIEDAGSEGTGTVQFDSYSNEADGLISLTPLTTGNLQVLPFGTVQAVCGLYVEVDAACTLTLNGTVTYTNGIPSVSGGISLPLKPNTAETNTPAKFFAETTVTSMAVSAAPTSTVSGMYCVWGDPNSL